MVASRFQSFCCLFASGVLVASGFESLCCPVAVGLLVASGLKGFGCLVASSSWVQLVLRGFLYSGLFVADCLKVGSCPVARSSSTFSIYGAQREKSFVFEPVSGLAK